MPEVPLYLEKHRGIADIKKRQFKETFTSSEITARGISDLNRKMNANKMFHKPTIFPQRLFEIALKWSVTCGYYNSCF